jgi:mercuric ion transport protein
MEQRGEQKDVALVWTGLIGSVLVALCCFTPFFVVLLGVVGLGAVTGYLDYVLLPALAVCVGITVYGLYRQRRSGMKSC